MSYSIPDGFTLVCNKCGCEDCTTAEEWSGGGDSGFGYLVATCPDCEAARSTPHPSEVK